MNIMGKKTIERYHHDGYFDAGDDRILAILIYIMKQYDYSLVFAIHNTKKKGGSP